MNTHTHTHTHTEHLLHNNENFRIDSYLQNLIYRSITTSLLLPLPVCVYGSICFQRSGCNPYWSSKEETWESRLRPDALPVAQPTVSRHWTTMHVNVPKWI